MDVNEHERLTHFTLKSKFMERNRPFIAVLHMTVTLNS